LIKKCDRESADRQTDTRMDRDNRIHNLSHAIWYSYKADNYDFPIFVSRDGYATNILQKDSTYTDILISGFIGLSTLMIWRFDCWVIF